MSWLKLVPSPLVALIFLVHALAPLSPAAAKGLEVTQEQVAALRPGAFLWTTDQPKKGPVTVVIGLREQRAYVYRKKRLVGVSTISSGAKGKETPIGRFHVLEKKVQHKSNRYSAAPMPFMQRLNWYGVAIHGGEIPGRPASHGCVRLPMAFANALFSVTEIGSYVFITESDLETPKAALKLARRHAKDPIGPDRAMPKTVTASLR